MDGSKESQSKEIKPYGHHAGDGIVQICFTLPVECTETAQAVALAYAGKMGLKQGRVTWMEAIGPQYTYFIIYGESEHSVTLSEVRGGKDSLPRMAQKPTEVDQEFRQRLGRRIVILVCTDRASEQEIEFEAMVSLEGISGEVGLEGYPTFNVRRERNVESIEQIIELAEKHKADALLVCEPTGGWGQGEGALKDLARKVKKAKDLPPWLLLSCWRLDGVKPEESVSGYDLCLSTGVSPGRVADQIVAELIRRGIGKTEGDGSVEEGRSRKKRGLLGIFSRDR